VRQIEVYKGCGSCETPQNYGWVRCISRNGIEEQNKLQPNTFHVVVDLLNCPAELSEIHNILSSSIPVRDDACLLFTGYQRCMCRGWLGVRGSRGAYAGLRLGDL